MPTLKSTKSAGDKLADILESTCDEAGIEPRELIKRVVDFFLESGSTHPSSKSKRKGSSPQLLISWCDINGKAGEVYEEELYQSMQDIADKIRMDVFAQCDFWWDLCQCKDGVCFFYHPKGTQEWKKSVRKDMPTHKGNLNDASH